MLDKIMRDDYLRYAEDFTEAEKDLMNDCNNWLPDDIIDCHAHCNLPEHVLSIRERDFHHMYSTFPSFSLEESQHWNHLFHQNKKIRTLRFPGVIYGTDHKAANDYLLDNSPENDRVAIFGLPDDLDYTIQKLGDGRVSALKMYAAYFEPAASHVFEFYPKSVLEVAQDKDVPIILHPPDEISSCVGQILEVIKEFPQLKICIAHIGLNEAVPKSFIDALTALAQYQNVYFDTALVQSSDVIRAAIEIVGHEKIMFGSDAPVHIIRSTTYQNPSLGWRLATTFPYHWVDMDEHKEFKHLARDVPHDHWQAIMAIRKALSGFSSESQMMMKSHIFHDNAQLFYGF